MTWNNPRIVAGRVQRFPGLGNLGLDSSAPVFRNGKLNVCSLCPFPGLSSITEFEQAYQDALRVGPVGFPFRSQAVGQLHRWTSPEYF